MFLIVGLGNPGEEYEHTRHNAGFDTVDKIASEIGVRYWKNECGALTGKGAYHDIDVVLAKPQSYMNTSGGPVKQLMNAYGVSPDCLVVIHDELDIDPGTIRVKFGGGHAGHNGLRSICDKLGTRLVPRALRNRAPAGTHAGGRLRVVPSQERRGGRLRAGDRLGMRGGTVPHRAWVGEDAAEIQLACGDGAGPIRLPDIAERLSGAQGAEFR